jgi:hypothetical protein
VNYLANGVYRPNWSSSVDQQVRASAGSVQKSKAAAFRDFTAGTSKTFLIGEADGWAAAGSVAYRMLGIWTGDGDARGFQAHGDPPGPVRGSEKALKNRRIVEIDNSGPTNGDLVSKRFWVR